MYGRGHGTGDWQGGWNPPADYLAEEEARIQAMELEWQQRETVKGCIARAKAEKETR